MGVNLVPRDDQGELQISFITPEGYSLERTDKVIGEIEDQGYGWVIQMVLPAAGEIQLYQPNHPLAYNL